MENEFRMKTLKSRFDELLIHVADNLTSDDRTKFRYIFRESLPRQILETNEPLGWFDELERKGKLAADDLGFLEDFLKQSHLIALLNVVKRFKIKRQLLVALRESSECRSRGRLRFEVLLADHQFCDYKPSKHFIRKCKNVIGRFSRPSGWNRKNVVALFNRAVKLYIASCDFEGYEAEMVYYKALYLVDQLYQKFGSWLLENSDVVPFLIKKTTRKPRFRRRAKKSRIFPSEPLANTQHPVIQATCQPANTRQLLELLEETNSHLGQISKNIKILAFIGGLALVILTALFLFLAMNYS